MNSMEYNSKSLNNKTLYKCLKCSKCFFKVTYEKQKAKTEEVEYKIANKNLAMTV